MFFRVSSEAGGIPVGGKSLSSIRAGRIRVVHWAHRLIRALLIVSQLLTFGYMSLSIIIATQVAYTQPKPITRTPAALGLSFQDVAFPSREDHVLLRWLVHPWCALQWADDSTACDHYGAWHAFQPGSGRARPARSQRRACSSRFRHPGF